MPKMSKNTAAMIMDSGQRAYADYVQMLVREAEDAQKVVASSTLANLDDINTRATANLAQQWQNQALYWARLAGELAQYVRKLEKRNA
jgi:hypothetical protein